MFRIATRQLLAEDANVLDDRALESFRHQLQALRRELQALEQVGDDAAQTVELDQTRVGRLSRMDALQNQAMSLEAQRRRRHELQQIDAALRRINDGSYGECLGCGEFIAAKRLQANPIATLCLKCAEEAETRNSRN